MKRIIFFILFVLQCYSVVAQKEFNVSKVKGFLGNYIGVYQTPENLSLKDVINKNDFKLQSSKIPNLGVTSNFVWVKFIIKNSDKKENYLLSLEYPMLDTVELYQLDKKGVYVSTKMFEGENLKNRNHHFSQYIFDLHIPTGSSRAFYFKISNTEQILLPFSICNLDSIWEKERSENLINGFFFGVIIIMFFFNLFIYFSVKDVSYLYYVLYVLFVGLTQLGIKGHLIQTLLPVFEGAGGWTIIFFAILGGGFGILFTMKFLNLKNRLKWSYYVFIGLLLFFSLSLLLLSLGSFQVSFIVMQSTTMITSLFIILVAILLLLKGDKTALFFSIAWFVLIFGAITFMLKDINVLPLNFWTQNSMEITVVIQISLFSFALASRINFYKKEKEKSQEAALELLKDNHNLVENQKDKLEREVKERTAELEQTLNHLKSTQIQLVEAEKMSSLGQLTAGIAHEINNPINFVSSNIPPLKEDLKDLNKMIVKYEELRKTDNTKAKWEEIDALKEDLEFDYLQTELKTIINGIEDGANRTAAIVKGLKNFSRLDEEEIKLTKINEGIKSTVVLIRHKLEGIKLIKNLGDIPDCYCNPAKINQLIMNLIDNAIYAIHKKEEDNTLGEIKITTEHLENKIKLTFSDNGVGISDEVKVKLFEPFFTTKDVGEGTGLGMSIVKGIVDGHDGKIDIETKLGEGTTITVVIPINK